MSVVDPMVALLAAVKTYLQITWTDTETENRLKEIINAGIYYVASKLAMTTEENWSSPGFYAWTDTGFARTLLFEYVRYARDGALDVYENNYRALILAAQHERMV